MARELDNGSTTPERIAIKPKSVLQKIMDILEPRTAGKNADIFIAGNKIVDMVDMTGDEWVLMIISPIKPIDDLNELNTFSQKIFDQLLAGIEGEFETCKLAYKTESDQPGAKKGITMFPYITYGKEVIGETVTARRIKVSDPRYKDVELSIKPITRSDTTLRICPSPKIARASLRLERYPGRH